MTVEEWQVDAVRDALQRASDVGEARSRSQLQAECGIGAGDMQGVLDALREKGELTETAPGEYETLTEAIRAEREAARAPAPAETHADEPSTVGAGARSRARGATARAGDDDVRVQLDAAVAAVMDAAALGALVKAGIDEAAKRESSFVFVVEG